MVGVVGEVGLEGWGFGIVCVRFVKVTFVSMGCRHRVSYVIDLPIGSISETGL